jgi:CheY-like chemotaxis protein
MSATGSGCPADRNPQARFSTLWHLTCIRRLVQKSRHAKFPERRVVIGEEDYGVTPLIEARWGVPCRIAEDPMETPDRHRILVVDDNIDAARSMSRVLTLLFGQEVQVAYDGPSALASADSFRPEIVFLDIGLPGMSGLDVAASMREQAWHELRLLVAVSGWGQEKDRQKTRAAGFDLHLVKPVKPEMIRDVLLGKIPSAR